MNTSRRLPQLVEPNLLRLLELERRALARVEKLSRKIRRSLQKMRTRDDGGPTGEGG